MPLRLRPEGRIGHVESGEAESCYVAKCFVCSNCPIASGIVDVPVPLEVSLVCHAAIVFEK